MQGYDSFLAAKLTRLFDVYMYYLCAGIFGYLKWLFSFQVVGREKGVFWKDLRPKLRAGRTFQTTEFIQRTVRTKFFKYSGRNAMTTYNKVWHRFLRLMNIIHLYQGSIHLPSVSLYVSTFFLAVLNPWQTQAFSLSGFREPSQTGRRTPCGL